ncbi:MAG: peptidase [Rhodospirillales bacterium]|nr:peptidase [Rhodospirillales bacterium]
MASPIINTLGWLDNPNPALHRPPADEAAPIELGEPEIDARALQDAHASGLTAIHTTVGYVAGPMDPFAHTVQALDTWDRVLATLDSDLTLVRSAADLRQAQAQRRIGVIFGFQNSVMLGGEADRVDLFAGRGVRVIQLTYNMRNDVGDGSGCAENRGLTAFGRDVVERLNAARVIVDLSHSAEATCVEAVRHSTQPVAITHTGCRALADLPRNKHDEELRLVAERGGFVGMYFMPFLRIGARPTAADAVAHIEHAVRICGEDHVGIGTDGTVTPVDDLGLYRGFISRQIEARRKSGIGAAGENADSYTFVEDLRGVDQFRTLAELLRRRGHSETRIEKILGRNFLRFAEDVWGG